MYESYVTVVGNLTADPALKHTKAGKPFATFRVASTPRRWDSRTGGFVDGGTNFVSVAAFNSLAANVVASCQKGQPVIVYGRLRVNSWASADGPSSTSVEIDAYHVGHDLTRGQSSFAKMARSQFDPGDRLGSAEVQDSLHGLPSEESVPPQPPTGSQPTPGELEAPPPWTAPRPDESVTGADDDAAGVSAEDREESEQVPGGAFATDEGDASTGDRSSSWGYGDPATDPYVVARAS